MKMKEEMVMRLMMRKIFMPTELLIEVLRYLNYAISSPLLSSGGDKG